MAALAGAAPRRAAGPVPGHGLSHMINNASIVFSIVAVFWVGFRAIVLDRTLPWFGDAPGRPSRR